FKPLVKVTHVSEADAKDPSVPMSDEELEDSLRWLLFNAPLTNKNSVVQYREYQGAPTVIAELDMLSIYGASPDVPLAQQHPLVRWVDLSTSLCGFGFVIHTATLGVELGEAATFQDVLGELFSEEYAQRVTPLVIGMSLEDCMQRLAPADRRAAVRELVSALKAQH
ncbi:MAG TPA: hypothetical protein VN081_06765, partial [Dongiaceae bacterium]|nr:hypothetical protein [Dongiaceae bacterium]